MDINKIMQELAEYVRMSEELNGTIEGLKDTLKAYMVEKNEDTLVGKEHKVTYKSVTASRVDTVALKKELPDVAARYTKITEFRRFTFV